MDISSHIQRIKFHRDISHTIHNPYFEKKKERKKRGNCLTGMFATSQHLHVIALSSSTIKLLYSSKSGCFFFILIAYVVLKRSRFIARWWSKASFQKIIQMFADYFSVSIQEFAEANLWSSLQAWSKAPTDLLLLKLYSFFSPQSPFSSFHSFPLCCSASSTCLRLLDLACRQISALTWGWNILNLSNAVIIRTIYYY